MTPAITDTAVDLNRPLSEIPPEHRWRRVWRVIMNILPTEGLEALALALASNSTELMQGGTCSPPPLSVTMDWPVEAADAIGFCRWKGDGAGRSTVGDVNAYFARVVFLADLDLQEPAGVRFFVCWWDEEPRGLVFPMVLAEVNRVLAERQRKAG